MTSKVVWLGWLPCCNALAVKTLQVVTQYYNFSCYFTVMAAPRTQVGRVMWQAGLFCVICGLPWMAGCWQPHLGP